MDEPSSALSPNRAVNWMASPFTWTFYLLCVALIFLFLEVMGVEAATAWSATHVTHCVLSFIFLHWLKGSPDNSSQGEYNGMTVYEQIDEGVPWTPTKKFLTIMPCVTCLLASVMTDYAVAHLWVNVPAFVICTIAKIPEMHRVRLFGINSTVGIDDSKAD